MINIIYINHILKIIMQNDLIMSLSDIIAEENKCESTPCMNNGICVQHEDVVTCKCLPGYTGLYCETG